MSAVNYFDFRSSVKGLIFENLVSKSHGAQGEIHLEKPQWWIVPRKFSDFAKDPTACFSTIKFSQPISYWPFPNKQKSFYHLVVGKAANAALPKPELKKTLFPGSVGSWHCIFQSAESCALLGSVGSGSKHSLLAGQFDLWHIALSHLSARRQFY